MRSLTFFAVLFKGRKKRRYHVICGLPYQKRKEKKADDLSAKQIDVTTERFLQFLSSSAWVWIFCIYIDGNKEEREREREREKVRESPFIIDSDNLIFQIILSSYLNVVFFFITIRYEILFIYWFILFRSWFLLIWIIKKIFHIKFNRHYWPLYSRVILKHIQARIWDDNASIMQYNGRGISFYISCLWV